MNLPYAPRGSSLQEKLIHFGWTVTESGCWEWNGRLRKTGYGLISHERKILSAHRVAYEVWVGKIPEWTGHKDGLCVCHRCDNPPCINPAHLFLGTQVENLVDRDSKFRGAKIVTPRMVDEIRSHPQEKGATLAERLGISSTTVSEIRSGRTWSHYRSADELV